MKRPEGRRVPNGRTQQMVNTIMEVLFYCWKEKENRVVVPLIVFTPNHRQRGYREEGAKIAFGTDNGYALEEKGVPQLAAGNFQMSSMSLIML